MYFIVLVYEIMWIGFLYCFLTQEQIMNENKNKEERSEHSTSDISSNTNENLDEFDKNSIISSNEMKRDISESDKGRKKNKNN